MLINARENTPEKLDLRHEADRVHAGQRLVHTHESAKNQSKWWRGRSANLQLLSYEPNNIRYRLLVRLPALTRSSQCGRERTPIARGRLIQVESDHSDRSALATMASWR